MVRTPGTGTSTAASARPAWAVPAAYTWVAGFALMHALAIVSNGGFGAGVDPGTGDSGLDCVLPNAVVIAICCVAVGVLHRTTGPPRPFIPRSPRPISRFGGDPASEVGNVSVAVISNMAETLPA
ncbi:hypothetical protein [Streptomyces sp. NPDC054961]